MAESKGPGQSKTLEMRVAELEDKLSQMHISEEEMQTYQKVAAKLGASPCQQCTASPCVAAQQQPCVASQAAPQQPLHRQPAASHLPHLLPLLLLQLLLPPHLLPRLHPGTDGRRRRGRRRWRWRFRRLRHVRRPGLNRGRFRLGCQINCL